MDLNKIKKYLVINNFITISLSVLPIAIIIGPGVVNSLIVIISLLFFSKKIHWHLFTNIYFKLFFIFFLYLVINSFLSQDPLLSIIRTFSYLKFAIFSLALAGFLSSKIKKEIIFKIWILTISIIIIDVYFEKIFGNNIIGFVSTDPQRIASFFNKELIVGSFLFAFSFLAFSTIYKKKPRIYWTLILLIGLAIFFSGERAIFFKYLILIFINFFFFEQKIFLIKKIVFIFTFFLLIVVSLKISTTTKDRQFLLFDTLLSDKQNKYSIETENIKNNLYKIKHFAHYYTAWRMFKDHPFFGSGLKTYRIACANPNYFNEKIAQSEVRCTTHPHQIHFEILSELGMTGYLMFLIFFFYLLYMAIKQYIKNRDILLLNSTLYILIALIPIIPSGSFFGTISGVFFFTNIGFILSFIIRKNK
jgi:O-antigen ligase